MFFYLFKRGFFLLKVIMMSKNLKTANNPNRFAIYVLVKADFPFIFAEY